MSDETLTTLDIIAQIGITILSASFLFLVARKSRVGWVCGIASQPFWFYTTIVHEQWLLMGINVLYLGNHIYGLYNWTKNPPTTICPHCKERIKP